jgi:transcriptional regulator with XRE-family HTH domain
MDLTQQIGQRLREARLAQSLPLGERSARTASPLSKSRIGNYEQGIRRPGLGEARELATALGIVSAPYLLCLENEGYLSEDEQRLLRDFRTCGGGRRFPTWPGPWRTRPGRQVERV